ncbi:MAG: NYN domain-containing protein [Clostridiales Family XIII bacterium]|jgi:uncharacterized protein (TIGR00288 family)|nr:NYN domain-containing protein [Clostridiales Family XIII bacterium]
MNDINEKRVAVLIDAENIGSKNIDQILDKASLEGRATVKRIYGDFSANSKSSQATDWNKIVSENALGQVQQIMNSRGKNSSDSALIIDAMDLLYSNTIDVVCLVTNDSDFTRLAMRIAESGLEVIGMGTSEQDCSKSFVNACTKFYYLNEQKPQREAKKAAKKTEKKQTVKDAVLANSSSFDKDDAHKVQPVPKNVIDTIITAIENQDLDDDDWANIAPIGSVLYRKYPDFNPAKWNRPTQLSKFILSLDDFEVAQGENIGKHSGSYIRIRT